MANSHVSRLLQIWERLKKPLAVFAALVGFSSGLVGLYQWAVPVPVSISSSDLKSVLADRSPCELIGARGLPCTPAGMAEAAGTDKETLDLFFAAGMTGNSLAANGDYPSVAVWAKAFVANASLMDYLIERTISVDHVLKVNQRVGCYPEDPIKNMSVGMLSGTYRCSATAQVFETRDNNLFCKVYFYDEFYPIVRGKDLPPYAMFGENLELLARMKACDAVSRFNR